MVASLLERNPIDEKLLSLTALVEQLQQEVGELRRENAQLRQQVSELRCDVGYWKSRHSDALKRNVLLQDELDQARAEIRQLKAERFGKQSEKQSSADRSNDLDDPQEPPTAKKRRGQQPGRPAPKRRDYAHLPQREEQVDVSPDDKVCAGRILNLSVVLGRELVSKSSLNRCKERSLQRLFRERFKDELRISATGRSGDGVLAAVDRTGWVGDCLFGGGGDAAGGADAPRGDEARVDAVRHDSGAVGRRRTRSGAGPGIRGRSAEEVPFSGNAAGDRVVASGC